MSAKTKVTLFKGGSKEITIPVADVNIPDAWKILDGIEERLGESAITEKERKNLLTVWHIAGNLLREIRENVVLDERTAASLLGAINYLPDLIKYGPESDESSDKSPDFSANYWQRRCPELQEVLSKELGSRK